MDCGTNVFCSCTKTNARDVVNEAIADGDNPKVLFKDNLWYPAVPDYVTEAFTKAVAVGGNSTKYFYNDYSVGSATGWSSLKSEKMYVS